MIKGVRRGLSMTSKLDKWTERKARSHLADILPLETPLSIQIFPTLACNFKCVYCIHSHSQPSSSDKFLDPSLFYKLCGDLEEFPNQIKVMFFSGLGEPLLHPQLPEMISAAKRVAEEVVVITNGSLLNRNMAERLMFSGLDVIRISLQGLTSEEYASVCGRKIDYNDFMRNIASLREFSGKLKVYVNIPDICVNSDIKKEEFFRQYGNICDGALIQVTVPKHNGIDYAKIESDFGKAINAEALREDVLVCPLLFYSAALGTNGEVYPCCWSHPDNKLMLGNIKNESFHAIWNGEELKRLRKIHLKRKRFDLDVCGKKCDQHDIIDDQSDALYKKFFP